AGAADAASVKRPLAPVRARPSCAGAPALAAQSVTVALAIGAPAPSTTPLRRSAAKVGADIKRLETTNANDMEDVCMIYLTKSSRSSRPRRDIAIASNRPDLHETPQPS